MTKRLIYTDILKCFVGLATLYLMVQLQCLFVTSNRFVKLTWLIPLRRFSAYFIALFEVYFIDLRFRWDFDFSGSRGQFYTWDRPQLTRNRARLGLIEVHLNSNKFDWSQMDFANVRRSSQVREPPLNSTDIPWISLNSKVDSKQTPRVH